MRGERVFAGVVGLFGLLWITQALRLRYWGDFAPDSGFLPFWLGVVLVALVGAFLIVSVRSPALAPAAGSGAAAPAFRRIGAIIIGLLIAVAALEHLGFAVSVGAYLVFLIGAIERRSVVETVGVSLATVAAIHLVFRVWLQVPLPAGPWGF